MANAHFQQLYATKEYTDLTIVTKTKEFSVHKVVVCVGSPGLKELQQQHGDRIDVPYRADVVERMIQFLYTVEMGPVEEDVTDEVCMLGKLADAATKYQIKTLQDEVLRIAKDEIAPRLTKSQEASDAAMELCATTIKGQLQRSLMMRAGTLADAEKTASQREKSIPGSGIAPSLAGKPRPKKGKKFCICKAKEDDPMLVQCDGCDEWFHPVCIGKSTYAQGTIKARRGYCLEGDAKKFGKAKMAFLCMSCDV